MSDANSSDGHDGAGGARGSRRHRAILLAAASVAVDASAPLLRGWGLGGRVVVRCRDGHLFSTIWIPGASVKSLRLGWWRIQRCPVGKHWSIVTPVRRSKLTGEQALTAGEHKDIRLP